MMRRLILLGLLLLSGQAIGCRSCFLLNPYANAIDDISDTHVYFDNWYYPRLDISRAGRPDWCGPINSRLGKNICYLGCYDRFDDCNLYPPVHPYVYPGSTFYEQQTWTPPSPTTDSPAPMPGDMPPTPSPIPIE